MKDIKTSYCVVGSGIAGLFAALTLAETQAVLLVTKNTLLDSNSFYAQGGIAVALSPLDNPSKHIEDTLLAGDGLCDVDNVQILVKEGIERVKEIIALGVQFDTENGSLKFTKEGAHQENRILHVKDMTGKAIIQTLTQRVKAHPNITILDHAMFLELSVSENKCHGCYVLKDSAIIGIRANAVLLATGGAANVYWPSTNPKGATGDGIAIAHRHGAVLKDMEFMQFHPTVFIPKDRSQSPFLISEAVRGEGAFLVDQHGCRFMKNRHPMAELAPRNVVAQAIYDEVNTHGNSVFLDMTHILNSTNRFPTIVAYCKKQGLDPTKDRIPVFPAAHYFMGGIKTSSWGETSIKQLYAAGECASLGIHGANRLASNSLLEGLVFSHRASRHMVTTCTTTHHEPLPIKKSASFSTEPMDSSIRETIQKTMWTYAGIVKTEESLLIAKETLNHLKETYFSQEKHKIDIETQPNWNHLQENYFLLINAISMIDFSIKRTTSLGSFIKR